MFIELNPAYWIAMLFFATSGSYIILSVVTYKGNIDTRPQQDYLATGAYLAVFSLFYGFMTIAANETAFRIFWAIGYIAGFAFFPGWILFLSNKSYPNNKPVRHTLVSIFSLTLLIAAVCVLSNDVIMISTQFGNRFSYYGSVVFIIAFVHLSLLMMALLFFQIKWWQKSEITRYRKEALGFIVFSSLAVPIGFLTDFILPTLTNHPVIPLGSISILAASIPMYVSMRKNKTLSIELRNVSGRIFESVPLPVLVLDHKNIVKLENESAAEFFGHTINGKNAADMVLVDGISPEQSFFENTLSSETVTAKTPTGERMCEMMLTVEKDKYNDALYKIIVINDLTELLLTLEQANDANKAKSDFLTGISQKIRVPVIEVIDRIEIMRYEHTLPKDVQESFEVIQKSCNSLLNVTNTIMDFDDSDHL